MIKRLFLSGVVASLAAALALAAGSYAGLFASTPEPSALVAETTVCDVSWAGAVDGNWNDATKWNTGVVPGASDNVCINATGAGYTVTLNVSPSIAGFTLDSSNATLSGTVKTLSVAGPSTLSAGRVVFHTANWAGAGTLTNGAIMEFRGSSTVSSPLVQNGSLFVLAGVGGGSATLTVSSGFGNSGIIRLDSLGVCPTILEETTEPGR